MEIKDFISSTIKQISLGVKAAQSECQEYNTIVNPPVGNGNNGDYYVKKYGNKEEKWRIQTLDMDIAVTVTETTDGATEGKIGIASIGASMNRQHGYSTNSESRIRFSIPICLPMSYTV